MESLYAWHRLASDVALAYELEEDRELKMSTELSLAIQTGAVRCWQENGDPIRGAVPLNQIRRRAPHLTVAEGNAWLKRTGYLEEWAPAKDRSTKHGTNKRWTENEVKRLAEYRKNHTEKQTAKHFEVTGTRVREILAKAKAQGGTLSASQKATYFSGLGKR